MSHILPEGVSLDTIGVRGGLDRSGFFETSEALYLTSGYVYDSAEAAERAFTGEDERYVYSRYGNPTVNIDVSAQKQGIHISGRVRVFDGFYSELFEADVSSSGVAISFSSSAGGIFASTSLKLDRSGFALSMAPGFNFGFSLFGVDLSVGIRSKIDITITESGFSQSIGFPTARQASTCDAWASSGEAIRMASTSGDSISSSTVAQALAPTSCATRFARAGSAS